MRMREFDQVRGREGPLVTFQIQIYVNFFTNSSRRIVKLSTPFRMHYETGSMTINYQATYAFPGNNFEVIDFSILNYRCFNTRVPFEKHLRDPVFKGH